MRRDDLTRWKQACIDAQRRYRDLLREKGADDAETERAWREWLYAASHYERAAKRRAKV